MWTTMQTNYMHKYMRPTKNISKKITGYTQTSLKHHPKLTFSYAVVHKQLLNAEKEREQRKETFALEKETFP